MSKNGPFYSFGEFPDDDSKELVVPELAIEAEIDAEIEPEPVEEEKVEVNVPAPLPPIRTQYKHLRCGYMTQMTEQMAANVAAYPQAHNTLYCQRCGLWDVAGPDGFFVWEEPENNWPKVGA